MVPQNRSNEDKQYSLIYYAISDQLGFSSSNLIYSAAAILAMQSVVLATAIPSQCPSVCPSHAGTLSRPMKLVSRGLHCEVAKTLSFSDTNKGWGEVPFHLKFGLRVTHHL